VQHVRCRPAGGRQLLGNLVLVLGIAGHEDRRRVDGRQDLDRGLEIPAHSAEVPGA
jgi:hypothetical protein